MKLITGAGRHQVAHRAAAGKRFGQPTGAAPRYTTKVDPVESDIPVEHLEGSSRTFTGG